MSSSINELLTDATKRPVHIAVFGRPGVGKSTIGNFILNNCYKGPFKTSSGTDACTRVPKTKSCDNVSFTDFPGLEPKSTKFCYNMCIDELKCRKYSVLLFVFPKGRVEVDVYKRAGILFREINKVECTKILIINDMNSYAFDDPSPNYENEISNLAGEISACTNILFNKTISMTKETMKEKTEDLMVTIKSYRRRPVMYPQLRNFGELVLWVDELRGKKEYHAAVRKEKTEEKERLEGELRMYRLLETGIVIAGPGAAVAGGALAAEAVPPALRSLHFISKRSGTATFGGLHFISNALDERIKKIEEELDQGEFDAAAEELEKETLELAKLRDALDAQEQEGEEKEEEEEEEKSD